MTTEIWKTVPGSDGRYEVSSLGRVRSVERQFECRNRWGGSTVRMVKARDLKTRVFPNGYGYVHLSLEAGLEVHLVHRLVAAAFVGDVTGKQVNHRDGKRLNNAVSNLELVTCSQNHQHAHTLPWRKKHSLTKRIAAALPEGPGLFESMKAFVRYLESVGVRRCAGSVASAIRKPNLCAGLPVWEVTNG